MSKIDELYDKMFLDRLRQNSNMVKWGLNSVNLEVEPYSFSRRTWMRVQRFYREVTGRIITMYKVARYGEEYFYDEDDWMF